MTEPQNFFTSGGTLGRWAKCYVTRRADEDLLCHLRNGDFCYVLTSRQMGKSSLMVHTADTLRREAVNVAILDLTSIGQNVSLEQWYDGLLSKLSDELDLENALDEYWTSERVARLGPMQRFMRALRDVVLPSVKGQVCLFVDEIDSVRSLPFSSDEFFAGIRECYNSRVADPEFNRLSFCLLGVAQPSDLITNVYITPFNIGHRIEITDFTETEAQVLLEGLRGKSTHPGGETAILHRILYWTGGHPYLTQKLCETVGHLEKDVTPADVDLICEDLFLSTRSREQQDNLIFVRDRVLASKELRTDILDLYKKVLRGEKVRDDDSNATIDPLRLSGLLVVRNGYLKVRNHIYARVFDRRWIQVNMPDAELRRQKAAFRRGILFALKLCLGFLAIVLCFSWIATDIENKAVVASYFASASSAQQAFNEGDYNTGTAYVNGFLDNGVASQYARSRYARLAGGFVDWLEDVISDRPKLTGSFAMKLLKSEMNGTSWVYLQRQDDTPSSSDNGEHKHSSCDAQIAVATTVYKGRPLIAGAGADSSVQIWDGVTLLPFAHLQLTTDTDGMSIHSDSVSPLKPCQYLADHSNELPGIMSVNFSSDGSHLAIATGSWRRPLVKGEVLVWDLLRPGQPDSVTELKSDFSKPMDWVEFSNDPNSEYLAASSEDATAEIWKFNSGQDKAAPYVINPRGVRSQDTDHVGGSGAHVISLSPMKQHIMAIGYGDGHLLLYNSFHPDPKRPSCAVVGDVGGITSMLFFERAQRLWLAIGGLDGDLHLIDPEKQIHSCGKYSSFLDAPTGQGVLQGISARTSPDGSEVWLLTSGSSGTVGLWKFTPDLQLLAVENLKGHTKGVHAAAFCQSTFDPASDRGCIVSASSDSDMRIWKYPFLGKDHSHHLLHGLTFPGPLLGIAYKPDKTTLVTAVGLTREDPESRSHSGVVATWNMNLDDDDKVLTEFDPDAKRPTEPLVGFGVSPDGRFLVSSTRNRDLVFVPLNNNDIHGSERQILPVHVTLNTKIQVRCINKDGNIDNMNNTGCFNNEYLVMGVADRNDIGDAAASPGSGLCMWRIHDTGPPEKPNFQFEPGTNPCLTPPDPAAPQNSSTGNLHNVGMFDISHDGKKIIMSVDSPTSTCVVLQKTHDLLNALHGDKSSFGCTSKSSGFNSQFAALSFSPDGGNIAATDIGSRMYFWPVKYTSKMPDESDDTLGSVTMFARGQVIAFPPPDVDADRDLVAVGLQDATIMLWNSKYRRIIMKIHQHHGGILGLAFSPDGNVLVSTGNDGVVKVMGDVNR